MKSTHSFQAEVSQVLKLVINSLYSNKEIFLRELVSNASDALDKLRFRAITEPELLGADSDLKITITPDRDAGTLTIADNGIGMTAEELQKNLGTIAWSGSREFAERLAAAGDRADVSLIGQFGVGFYSAYLVADRVEVLSRAAGSNEAYRWTSEAKDDFTIEPAERATRGTSLILHLKSDQREFAEAFRVRELVRRYSDYVGHPIELVTTRTVEGEQKTETEAVNQAKALWQRPASELSKEQYVEFYKHLTRDWEEPAAYKHFKIEGTQLFTGLVFVPKRKPFDLFEPDAKHGIRLHVKRVFVMEEADALLPRWLRFIKGLVDSEDLPLNVSREILQDSKLVKVIRKQVVSQSLTMLAELAQDDVAAYSETWKNFGAVLKEALVMESDSSTRDKVVELLRFRSLDHDAARSLRDYVAAMKEGQDAIYYVVGEDEGLLRTSPHLEALKKRGYDVLLLTDPVDPFALDQLTEFDGKQLVSASNAALALDEEKSKEQAAEAASLLAQLKAVLGERVAEVKVSTRLSDSPACLVASSDGVAPHVERMMRARGLETPKAKQVLEVNVEHPLLRSMKTVLERDGSSPQFAQWAELLHAQAQLAEGAAPNDPARFARQVAELLADAAARVADHARGS